MLKLGERSKSNDVCMFLLIGTYLICYICCSCYSSVYESVDRSDVGNNDDDDNVGTAAGHYGSIIVSVHCCKRCYINVVPVDAG